MRHPMTQYTITKAYGVRGDWQCGYHTGTDYWSLNPTIYSINAGRVVANSFSSSYGNYITIEHEGKFFSRYAHMRAPSKWAVGTVVPEGTILGYMGATGRAFGAHLHLEVFKEQVIYPKVFPGNTIDPIKYITEVEFMKYTKHGANLHTVEFDKLRLVHWNKPKKTTKIENYANGGFFADDGKASTPPEAMGNLAINGNIFQETRKQTYGDVKGKKVSTFIQTTSGCYMHITDRLDDVIGLEAAIAGIPMIIGGREASNEHDVKPQGWNSAACRVTWHSCLGIKNGKPIYVAYKSKKAGPIALTTELAAVCRKLGIKDLIKLDGGGSFVLDINGRNVAVTSENRIVHNLIKFDNL